MLRIKQELLNHQTGHQHESALKQNTSNKVNCLWQCINNTAVYIFANNKNMIFLHQNPKLHVFFGTAILSLI